jgi:hypothetical protein
MLLNKPHSLGSIEKKRKKKEKELERWHCFAFQLYVLASVSSSRKMCVNGLKLFIFLLYTSPETEDWYYSIKY